MTTDAVPGRRQRGFTLLELALTMLIMGILLALAVPRLPGTGRTDLEGSADRLAATMTYLADEASLRGRIYRLTVDLDDDEWTVAALAPFAPGDGEAARAEFKEDADDPMTRTTALPHGVFFDSVTDSDGETAAGRRAVYFLPEGPSGSVDVRLSEKGGASTDVVLDPVRGSARREETVETHK